MNEDEKIKAKIDNMSHYEMCRIWRFAKSGNPYISGETGQYFKDRLFQHFGGFTLEISKSLGWGINEMANGDPYDSLNE